MASHASRSPLPEGRRTRFRAGLEVCLRQIVQFTRPRFFMAGVIIGALVIAANIGIAIAVFSAAHHEASDWPGKSFTFVAQRNWQQIEGKIQALAPSSRLTSSLLGTVEYAQGTLPVHLLRFQSSSAARRPLRVLLVSGVHGTETAGPEALLELAALLSREPSRYANVLLDIVPVANPWGWVYGYRYDGQGEDVNRDFSSRRTQEAILIRRLVRRDGPFDLVMDLHESQRNAYFIYQYLPMDAGLGGEYVKIVESQHRPIAAAYKEWIFPVKGGILRTPPAALFWIALGRSMALDQFARFHGVRQAYTVETPSWDDFNTRVAVHLRTVQVFISRLLAERAGR